MVDPTELRRLAEKATPGPWHYSDVYASVTCDAPQDVDHNHFRGFADPDYEGRYLLCESVVHPPTRSYIAAMHPKTTLALLDRLAELEADLMRYKKALASSAFGPEQLDALHALPNSMVRAELMASDQAAPASIAIGQGAAERCAAMLRAALEAKP